MLLLPRDDVPDSPDVVEDSAIGELDVEGGCDSDVPVRSERCTRVESRDGAGVRYGSEAGDLFDSELERTVGAAIETKDLRKDRQRFPSR